MVEYLGKGWGRREIGKYLGDLSQIAGMKEYEFTSGKGRCMRGIDVWTGSGLRFTVLPDRGLDISEAFFNGQSLCWRSNTSDVHPHFFESEGEKWLRSFFGGLLTTCGLTYAGKPCIDEGESLGLHGRISNTPAGPLLLETIWLNDEYRISIKGTIRESRVHGENITLTREIITYMGCSNLKIHDVVENEGYKSTPHMILYHINIGFPVLREGSKFLAAKTLVEGQFQEDPQDIKDFDELLGPTPNYKPRVFSIKMKPDLNGFVRCAVINQSSTGIDVGVYLLYHNRQLPEFSFWKMMGEGQYVLGLEPGNCTPQGREVERKRGTLQILEPGEKREYDLEIGVITSDEDINHFKNLIMTS